MFKALSTKSTLPKHHYNVSTTNDYDKNYKSTKKLKNNYEICNARWEKVSVVQFSLEYNMYSF